MKKLFNIALTLLVAFLGIMSVNAASGSIEINRTEANYETTYNVYRLFDLTYDSTNKSYAYALNSTWAAFFTTGEGKNYVTLDTKTNNAGYKYVTIKSGADVAELAKKALKYAKDNKLTADGTTKLAKNAKKATVSNLSLGYYLVDSSLGALCHLSTTDYKATINEKNAEPNIEKEVTTPLNNGSAKIGDTVNYTITVDVEAGYENYVVTDKMTSGLTYDKNVSVKYLDKDNKEVTKTGAVIDNTATDNYTFKVDFSKVDLSNVEQIVVTYSAVINKNAVDTNKVQSNEAELTFGDGNKTDKTKTSVPVETFNGLFKKVNDKGADLTGARFVLYDAATGGNEIKVVKVSDGVYRVAESGETAAEYIEAGNVVIKGLAKTTYYLEETLAPDGYTKLGARVAMVADDTTTNEVVNTTGAVLPSTGGFGTAMFVLVGTLLVSVLGTVLISKYRISKYNI